MTIKHMPKTVAHAALWTAMLSAPVMARDTVIALSSAQHELELKAQTERALVHLLNTLEPGETARFMNAKDATLIGAFTIPDGTGTPSQQRILNHNRDVLAKLGKMMRETQVVPGQPAWIDLPKVLASVRENYPAPEGGADLIVLGNPLYTPFNAPSQSMAGGRVPSDAHISARAGQSVYATTGLPGSLEGYDVYFGLIGEGWAVSPPHAQHVTRFWTVSVEGHQASMAYIGEDLETLFARAGRDAPDRLHSEPLRRHDKFEMLTFAADDGSVPDIYRTPLQVAPAPEPIWKAASNVTIGITWDVAGADLDLYVRPMPSAPVIFFGQADTEEGRLFKDFTLSPGTGFETVALTSVIDLSQTRLAVNYYGGVHSAGGVRGEIRIAIGDQVWAKPIHVTATRGNKGNGANSVVTDGEVPNAAWIIIDPLHVLGAR